MPANTPRRLDRRRSGSDRTRGVTAIPPLYKEEPLRPDLPFGPGTRPRDRERRAAPSAGRTAEQWRWVLQSPCRVGVLPASTGAPARREWDAPMTDAWEMLFEGKPETVEAIRRRLQITERWFTEWLRTRRPRARPANLQRARQIALGYLALSSSCLVYIGLLWNPKRLRSADESQETGPGSKTVSARLVRSVRHDLALFLKSPLYRREARHAGLQISH